MPDFIGKSSVLASARSSLKTTRLVSVLVSIQGARVDCGEDAGRLRFFALGRSSMVAMLRRMARRDRSSSPTYQEVRSAPLVRFQFLTAVESISTTTLPRMPIPMNVRPTHAHLCTRSVTAETAQQFGIGMRRSPEVLPDGILFPPPRCLWPSPRLPKPLARRPRRHRTNASGSWKVR